MLYLSHSHPYPYQSFSDAATTRPFRSRACLQCFPSGYKRWLISNLKLDSAIAACDAPALFSQLNGMQVLEKKDLICLQLQECFHEMLMGFLRFLLYLFSSWRWGERATISYLLKENIHSIVLNAGYFLILARKSKGKTIFKLQQFCSSYNLKRKYYVSGWNLVTSCSL